MGSEDQIKQDWELSELEKSLFGSDIWNNMNSIDADLLSGKIEAVLLNGGSSLNSGGRSDSDANFGQNKTHVSDNQNKRRGRTPTTVKEAAVSHVQAERERRERLNRRFYALRSAVPNASKMDKASLLGNAVVYINELKSKIEEMKLKLRSQTMINPKVSSSTDLIFNYGKRTPENRVYDGFKCRPLSLLGDSPAIDVDVKILGTEAVIRAHGHYLAHPPARLMNVLRELDLQIHHASISKVNKLILQDVVVRLPQGLNDEKAITSAIFQNLNN